MADLDDLREGSNFGLGVASTNNSFHVKGAEHLPWGMKDRLSRIFNPKTGRTVMLAFDHGFIMGPTSGLERIDLNIVPLIEYADCLMCTRGILRTVIPPSTNKPICLRSDAGTSILTELNDNVLIDVLYPPGVLLPLRPCGFPAFPVYRAVSSSALLSEFLPVLSEAVLKA